MHARYSVAAERHWLIEKSTIQPGGNEKKNMNPRSAGRERPPGQFQPHLQMPIAIMVTTRRRMQP
jgi:hypothetical protein